MNLCGQAVVSSVYCENALNLLVLRMTTGMDYAIHVQVEVVKLDAIWIVLRCIHGDSYSAHHFSLRRV